MRPVICMITDGRLAVARADGFVERVAAAARAGVDLIQIREPASDDRLLTAVVRECAAAVRGAKKHSPSASSPMTRFIGSPVGGS